jgi:NitT/TauT family transport system permease protein
MRPSLKVILPLTGWALLWEGLGRYLDTDVFPPLTRIVVAVFDLLHLPSFWAALESTAHSFAIGMAIAIIVGVPFGVLIGCSPAADRLANPWINIFISAPLTAVIPALVPLLGIGETPVVATVVLFAVWVIILDTQVGIRKVNGSLLEMSRVFGANPVQRFFLILVPAASPEILTAIRLGIVRGIKGVVIGQIVVSLVGFGAMFEDLLQSFSLLRFWGLVVIVFVLSTMLISLVSVLERRFAFYASER